jgi:hypothetical protein
VQVVRVFGGEGQKQVMADRALNALLSQAVATFCPIFSGSGIVSFDPLCQHSLSVHSFFDAGLTIYRPSVCFHNDKDCFDGL